MANNTSTPSTTPAAVATPATTKMTNAQSKNAMLKAFRSTAEVENFYRFVHENGLRHEAKILLEKVMERVKKAGGYHKKKTLN
jgi:hypothetical protein